MSVFHLDTRASLVRAPASMLVQMERTVEKVHERLMRTAWALENAGVSFAVIGGNAIAIWIESVDAGAARNTKDVDILLARTDLNRATAAMAAAGFDLAEVNGVTMFLDRKDPMPSRGVHVVFVGEKVRPHYQHPAPGMVNLKRSPEGIPALGLCELLAMKLQSYRDLDRVHIRDLLSAGLIDDDIVDRLPADLRKRLEDIKVNPDG